MKKLFMFALLALMTAGIAVAQDAAAGAQPPAQPTAQQESTVGQPTEMNESLYKGCLSGSKDNYILTDDKGNTFRLHSDKDINEHVGKMVEVRGNVKTEGVDSQKQPAAAGNAKDLDVGDIKSVSGSCPAAETK